MKSYPFSIFLFSLILTLSPPAGASLDDFADITPSVLKEWQSSFKGENPFLLKVIYERAERIPLVDPQKYLARKKEFGGTGGGPLTENQMTYARMFFQSVQMAKIGIRDHQWNFRQVLFFLAAARNKMARKLGHDPVDSFGALRNSEGRIEMTPMRGDKYAFCLERALEKEKCQNLGHPTLEKGFYDSVRWIGRFQKKSGDDGISVQENNGIRGALAQGLYRKKNIGLTEFIFHDCLPSKFEFERIFDSYDNGNPVGIMIHTPVKNLPEVLQNIGEKFVNLLEVRDREDRLARVASFYWWLSQAMPFQRGSASISEMLLHVIFELLEIPFQGFTGGTPPDLEALLNLNEEEFIQKFPHMVQFSKSFGP